MYSRRVDNESNYQAGLKVESILAGWKEENVII